MAVNNPLQFLQNGQIENTPIGQVTPAAGTFTTLTATGQVSLGGAAGSESVRVVVPGTTGNYWQFTGSSSDVAVNFLGASANIGASYIARGTGNHNFTTGTSASTVQMRVAHTASAVNYVQVTGAATGGRPTISAQGSDTNIDLTLTPKGTGNVRFGTYTASVLAPTGYVEIKDSGGTVRRLLVG